MLCFGGWPDTASTLRSIAVRPVTRGLPPDRHVIARVRRASGRSGGSPRGDGKLKEILREIAREIGLRGLIEEHAAELLTRAEDLTTAMQGPARIRGRQMLMPQTSDCLDPSSRSTASSSEWSSPPSAMSP